jgi:glycosyltransferase involved in cell wall biosynthesis
MKICFWGNIAGALKGSTDGGAELQIALLAKALAKAGHEVVIFDFQSPEEFTTDEGIKVLKIKGWDSGFRFLRTFTHRLPGIFNGLKAQRADIYYCRIRDFRHILAYWAARKVKARFVLGMASDLDAMTFLLRLRHRKVSYSNGLWGLLNGLLIEIIYPYLLRNADLVLVQHDGQKKILDNRGIKSRVFPNLVELSEVPTTPGKHENDFVYVGELSERKGFPEFFTIISNCPSHTFGVIGPPSDRSGHAYFEDLKSFTNVTLYGKLSHAEVLNHIINSKALISTSRMEGFPNIFIEAWACGIPVFSLYVDPGNVIQREGLGVVANGNLNKMVQAMDFIESGDSFLKRAKAYVEHFHELNEMKIAEVNDLFTGLLEKGKNQTF